MIKQLSAFFLLIFGMSPLGIHKALAQENISMLSGECQEAIARVGQSISSERDVTIFDVVSSVIQDWQQSPFPQGNYQVVFIVGLPPSNFPRPRHIKAVSFSKSPALQLTYTKPIFNSCRNVDIVEFGLVSTDNIIPHFRMPSGNPMTGIRLCQDRNSKVETVKWGYYWDCE